MLGRKSAPPSKELLPRFVAMLWLWLQMDSAGQEGSERTAGSPGHGHIKCWSSGTHCSKAVLVQLRAMGKRADLQTPCTYFMGFFYSPTSTLPFLQLSEVCWKRMENYSAVISLGLWVFLQTLWRSRICRICGCKKWDLLCSSGYRYTALVLRRVRKHREVASALFRR